MDIELKTIVHRKENNEMNEIKKYTEKVFEDIKHIDENENEYWLARELMPLLEYRKWDNFDNVIQKAVISYKNSNNDDSYWLPKVRKPIITGKGRKEFIKNNKYIIKHHFHHFDNKKITRKYEII